MEINSAFWLSFSVTCNEICVCKLKIGRVMGEFVGVFFHLCDLHKLLFLQWKWLPPPLCASFFSLFLISLSFNSEQWHLRFQLLAVLASNSSQSGTLQLPPSGWKRAIQRGQWGGYSRLYVLARAECFLFQLKFRSSVVTYNWCPLQSEYCSSGGSSCSMSGLVSCVRKQNGSHLWMRGESFTLNYTR